MRKVFFFDEGKKEQMRRFAAQVELEIRRVPTEASENIEKLFK